MRRKPEWDNKPDSRYDDMEPLGFELPDRNAVYDIPVTKVTRRGLRVPGVIRVASFEQYGDYVLQVIGWKQTGKAQPPEQLPGATKPDEPFFVDLSKVR